MRIEQRIASFVQSVVRDTAPDLIVPVERKGTAILRALIDKMGEGGLRWPWSQVVSSTALDFLTPEWVSEKRIKRILVFDEMIHHGRHLRDVVVNKLTGDRLKIRSDNITTAVFGVHEDCKFPLDRFCHSQLSEQTYQRLRGEIVTMLQRLGSLLLDTEHIEVTIRIRCSVNELVGLLSQEAEGCIVFRSGDNRLNVTVATPHLADEERFASLLPEGCDRTGVVNKCRVIQTSSPDEFVLVPIFYANTPAVPDARWIQQLPAFLQASARTPKGVFYVAGLLTALEILRSVVGTLRKSPSVTITCPRFTPDASLTDVPHEGGALNHLLALYPHLERHGPELEAYMIDLMREAEPPRKKRGSTNFKHISTDELDEQVRQLGSLIVAATDELAVRSYETDRSAESRRKGIPNRDVFALACDTAAMEPIVASAALDRLIDEAYLVTHVEEFDPPAGNALWGRTFEPDGELASAKIRRYEALHGFARRRLKHG